VDLEEIAKGTPGFTGADLENLLNEAALLTAENDQEIIDKETLDEARDKVMMGLQREEMVISDKEKKTMAIHESGHTLVAFFTDEADPVHKVTIIPRGKALGATQQLPIEEKKMYTREDLMGRLAVMMGGRAAESMKNETITNGAQDDLRRATKLARKMVLQWGMSSDLGNIAYQDNGDNVFLGEELSSNREYSEETAEKIDQEIKSILDDATRHAEETLRENEDELDNLVDVLIERESLTADEITGLLEDGELPENGSEPQGDEGEQGADGSDESSEPEPEKDYKSDEDVELLDDGDRNTEDSTEEPETIDRDSPGHSESEPNDSSTEAQTDDPQGSESIPKSNDTETDENDTGEERN